MKANNKKNSNTRKLIPAVGMLTASAMALTTATYAWFTMSREVEVNNIKMTATVPEDFQLSLGKLAVTGTPGTVVTEVDSATYSLGSSTGVLYAASGTVAGDGKAATPENTWDWSNSADISAYYDIGRLIPASSYNGTEIFFTPDASGVGKTVKGNANYIQATNALTAVADEGSTTSYKATLHALTNLRATDKWAEGGDSNYKQADSYNKTNDDGYYVDIPVWIRTSSNADVNLSVDGYVLPGSLNTETGASNKETDLELYRAVRVAILTDSGAVTVDTTRNIIPLKDAWDTSKTVTDGTFTAITAKQNVWAADNPSILDSINLNQPANTTQTRAQALSLTGDFSATGKALAGVSEVAAAASDPDGDGISDTHAPTYTVYNAIKPTSDAAPDTVATIAGSTTGKDYGEPTKLIIRVWLDGEDGECWNDNAGQDWAISLKFSKIETAASAPVGP